MKNRREHYTLPHSTAACQQRRYRQAGKNSRMHTKVQGRLMEAR